MLRRQRSRSGPRGTCQSPAPGGESAGEDSAPNLQGADHPLDLLARSVAEGVPASKSCCFQEASQRSETPTAGRLPQSNQYRIDQRLSSLPFRWRRRKRTMPRAEDALETADWLCRAAASGVTDTEPRNPCPAISAARPPENLRRTRQPLCRYRQTSARHDEPDKSDPDIHPIVPHKTANRP